MEFQKKSMMKTLFNKCSFMLPILIMALIVIAFLNDKRPAHAEEAIQIKEINYEDSTITLKVNSGDTTVYFSDSNRNSWEAVPGDIGSDMTISMDISWIASSRNYTLSFKADHSTGIVNVTIPKQATSFKASYNKVKGTVAFRNAGTRTIEWRKKDSSKWYKVDVNNLSSSLDNLLTNGAQIIFRLAPVNGTGVSNVGFRPSKEVSVTISKKAAPPAITINGSKLSIYLKKGMSYRVVKEDGTTTEWMDILRTMDYKLSEIAPSVLYKGNEGNQSEATLQFKMKPTTTTTASQISTITIPIQPKIPDVVTNGIELKYTSASSFSIIVKAASTVAPYEYTIVKTGYTLDIQDAVWTSITNSSPVSVSKTKAPEGSHIYIRKKSLEASETVDFSLASDSLDIAGSNGIIYPSSVTSTGVTTLVTTAGVCNANNTAGNLIFTLFSPTKATVSSITFNDAYGNAKGSVSLKSSVELNKDKTSDNDAYIITTKITSTENLDSFTKEKLYASITLDNSDTLTSSQSKGVMLYLYPATKVNNSADRDFTSSFNRVIRSTNTEDSTTFKFKLDFGVEKVVNKSAIDTYTSEPLAISSIHFDAYTLLENTDYKVEYGSYTNEDGVNIRTATITVNVANFETNSSIRTMNQEVPFVIYLNNGEILGNQVKMNLIQTATLVEAPIAWSITEGSLPPKVTRTVENSDGTKTTITEDAITYTLTLKLYNSSYNVSISDVTWGGISVLGSATIVGDKATIYLSNAKINKLSTDTTTTNNIEITLSNGYVIKSGCKLTIIDASN